MLCKIDLSLLLRKCLLAPLSALRTQVLDVGSTKVRATGNVFILLKIFNLVFITFVLVTGPLFQVGMFFVLPPILFCRVALLQ